MTHDCCLVSDSTWRSLQSADVPTCVLPRTLSSYGDRTFAPTGRRLWTGASPRGGLGWTCPPHFCQRPFLKLMQIRRVFFFWGGRRGVANVHVQQQPGCKCSFFAVLPVHLLAVHQWSNKNLVPMCAKVISISYTCSATYNNQETTPEQEVHKFYPFQALF